MQDSKKFLEKGMKASHIQFNYEEELIGLEDEGEEREEKIDILNEVKDIVLGTGQGKLDLINQVITKFEPTANLIIESNPELFEEVKNALYNKEMDSRIKDLLKL
jgi:hypothetical protein